MSTKPTADRPARTVGDDLYVGYLTVPDGYRRFLRLCIPPLVVGFVTAGALLAWSFRSPGDGRWETDREREFEGVIIARPYAMLRLADTDNGVRTILLVQEGKRGAADVVAGLDGQFARVRGTLLQRDGKQMLELSGPPERRSAPASTASPSPVADLGAVMLRGEIIDPKCYLGAMKPGEGKTHKACATLCIAGGIPPMFVTRDAHGGKTFYLLTDRDGGPAHQQVLPFVADPVEIHGKLFRDGDLLVLRLGSRGIQRL